MPDKDSVQLSRQFVAPRVSNDTVRIWPYAGNSENPALLLLSSDNATGADNQQERLARRTRENPQRPYARRLEVHQVKIWSHLHGDMQGRCN